MATNLEGISRFKKYRRELFGSGILARLKRNELAFMWQLVEYADCRTFFAYPGVRRRKRELGLDNQFQGRVAYMLGRFGLILGRKEVVIRGGKTWGYFLNPEVPKMEELEIEVIRQEVYDMYSYTNKGGRCTTTPPKVYDYWLKGVRPNELKPDTSVYISNNTIVAAQRKEPKKEPAIEAFKKEYPERVKEIEEEYGWQIHNGKRGDEAIRKTMENIRMREPITKELMDITHIPPGMFSGG